MGCPVPRQEKNGRWICPDQSLNISERRALLEDQKPWDEVNGEKLTQWKATAATTTHISPKGSWHYDYEGVNYVGYHVERAGGERAPIHYHEQAQLLCLEEGSILVKVQGQPDASYSAPDCYMMPAYTKLSVISITTKKEKCLLRIPHGGLPWVVLEPEFQEGLQGQWEPNEDTKTGLSSVSLMR
jgi:quercetin dioxygenase-like cupin family protein